MRTSSWRLGALGALFLAGCGGGGGGGDDGGFAPPPVTPAAEVQITAANQEAVARATLGSALALGQTRTTAESDRAQAASPLPAARRLGAAVAAAGRTVGAVVREDGRKHAAGARARPAQTTTDIQPCTLSGRTVVRIDDQDNNGVASVGDRLVMTFEACRDVADLTMDGTIDFQIDAVASALPGDLRFDGRMAFQQLRLASSDETASIDGAVDVAMTSNVTGRHMLLEVLTQGLLITADGPSGHDDITYLPGLRFTQEESASVAAQTLTLDGSFQASSIGGRVAVATPEPIFVSAVQDHPTGGRLVVTGAAGSRLQVSADPTPDVLLELDADGDGVFEASSAIAWAAL